ncbi:hypothetical protein CAPTEDRAFT_227361 [Capitella teleta]|uniref:Uncharacterized protein n=1 Tax=Capitella teleta TaxID=283909 RepID=R7TJ67_CAPTE|nr:hypothetical protein CAPTEDRAFT_227361 [Capitella teleta]|eukprot:ELT93749.1 hypothetical protein CAPTEDRAFT_227361 [Capitella teleta]
MLSEDSPRQKAVGYYVLNSLSPFEEDVLHEFKAHTNLCEEELPSNSWITGTAKRSRKAISRNINGFLNTGLGGTVHLGITDEGFVKGLRLTQYTRDHLVAALDDLMSRYSPPVEAHRYKINFVPVVESETTQEQRAAIVRYNSERDSDLERRQKEHLLRQPHYCWCHKDEVAQVNMGIIPAICVAEIIIKEWDPNDARNSYPVGKLRMHPIHQSEKGETFFRRTAYVTPCNGEELKLMSRQLVRARFEERIKKLKEKKAELLKEISAGLS